MVHMINAACNHSLAIAMSIVVWHDTITTAHHALAIAYATCVQRMTVPLCDPRDPLPMRQDATAEALNGPRRLVRPLRDQSYM